ncbi:MAG: diguanylate cyclase [Thermomonas sp.]
MSRLICILLLVVLMVAPTMALAFQDLPSTDQPPVLTLIVDDAAGDAGAAAMGRIRFRGGAPAQQHAWLEFDLPARSDRHWGVWLPRDPFDRVQVSTAGWASPAADFFHPRATDGALPVGYWLALPPQASGPQRLKLALQGSIRGAPTPQVLSEPDVLRRVGQEAALAYAVYAALMTLLIAVLALYFAVRDRLFLMYAGYTVSALLFMMTVNGHLYALPGLRVLGQLGANGFWALVLQFNAVALQMLVRFSDSSGSDSPLVRRLGLLVRAVAVLPLLVLLPIPALAGSVQAFATAAWLLAMLAGLLATLDGARRGVQMASAAGVALLLLLLSSGAHEAMNRAWLADGILTRHGYQFALVLMSVTLFVGLSSRIGIVRQRLEAETSARRHSEDRLHQERVRTGLAQALQERLRSAPLDEIAPVAFRLLGEHASELLGAQASVVLSHGFLGHNLLLTLPESQPWAFAQSVLIARGVVRTHAINGHPVQLRLHGARKSDDLSVPLRVVVPLKLASPAWAALVLPVPGRDGLKAGELDALVALAALTVAHAEEAHAAIQLRRIAEYDALTGSLNRRSLDQLLLREFNLARMQGTTLSVLFIDLDWFKRINDAHGHACGDHCLRSIAGVLRGELRPADALGRYGGEEFLVLLPGHDPIAARLIAERLRQAVERTVIEWQDQALALTISIGMAMQRGDDSDPPALLARADKALYVAKHGGRNLVRVAPDNPADLDDPIDPD